MPYWVKRLLSSVPLLICITFLSFLFMQLAPGDPTAMYQDPSLPASDVAHIRANLGLDKPILVQYFFWLKQAVKGDLGFSFFSGKPVVTVIFERMGATLLLSVSALVLILILTCPLGLWSGYKKGGKFDYLVTIFSFFGMALPSFWLGLMLILFFSVKLNWFPTSGYIDPMLEDASLWVKMNNILSHMVLPLLTIVVGGLAGLTRYFRFGVISILSQDYIKAARARGLSERLILYKHAFKNASLPIITLLGLQLPGLIGGSFVIEYIFAWPGLGKLGVDAVFARDYPVLMGTLLFSSILIVVGNLLADLAYGAVDPRIKELNRR